LFLGNLETIARAAAQAGIPFMTIVQGSRFGMNARTPTAGELRFLTYAPLAFGAQEISYFNYWITLGPASGGIAFPDGRPTSVYVALQKLSPSFKNIALHLQRLKCLGTFLKDTPQNRCREILRNRPPIFP
jgi:hypothetical protein